jgi:Zn-dependent protease with chaperone function
MNSPGTRAYLIRPGEINPGWLVLYAITWGAAWISAIFRFAVVYAILWVLTEIADWSLPIHFLALVAGWGPLVISVATLILPLGGWWWEQQSGARSPSEREQATFDAAFSELTREDPTLRPPRRWCVLDTQDANASVYADTLMVTRGLLENPFFPAVLAHELGHLNSIDGRLTAAIHRLTTPPRTPVRFPFRTIVFLATGRVAMALTRTPWAMYWRRREQIADEYAAQLGQGPTLAAFLDTHALDGDMPTPFKAFGDTSHPWTEHRIDHLQAR